MLMLIVLAEFASFCFYHKGRNRHDPYFTDAESEAQGIEMTSSPKAIDKLGAMLGPSTARSPRPMRFLSCMEHSSLAFRILPARKPLQPLRHM